MCHTFLSVLFATSIYPFTHTLGFGSELVVIFLKFLYDQDPVKQLLEASEVDHHIDIGL